MPEADPTQPFYLIVTDHSLCSNPVQMLVNGGQRPFPICGGCLPRHRHRNNRRSIQPAMPSSRSTKTMISNTSASVSAALKVDCAKSRR